MVEKGEIELELNPQGTLIERIRAGGFGLGGVLTPTGLGTIVEERGYGTRIRLNGRDWLYHTPLKADGAVVEAFDADEAGNLVFRRTQRNFCDTMCFAAETVIASVVNPIRKKGEIDPDGVMVPGVVVDYLVQREAEHVGTDRQRKNRQACGHAVQGRRACKPWRWHSHSDSKISARGGGCLAGIGKRHHRRRPPRSPDAADPFFKDAGDNFCTILPGGCTFNSCTSFGLIRGGHLAYTVLGAMQVDEKGNLANWIVPGGKMAGWAAQWICERRQEGGGRLGTLLQGRLAQNPEECTFPLTGIGVVDYIIPSWPSSK